MKEGTETPCYNLEDGHLLKLSSHTKIWTPISQIERDFEISKKNSVKLEKNRFWAKMLAIQSILNIFWSSFLQTTQY